MEVWNPDDPRDMRWVDDLERLRSIGISILLGLGVAIALTLCAMAFLLGLRAAECPALPKPAAAHQTSILEKGTAQ